MLKIFSSVCEGRKSLCIEEAWPRVKMKLSPRFQSLCFIISESKRSSFVSVGKKSYRALKKNKISSDKCSKGFSFILASTIVKSSLMPLLGGFTIKSEYNLSEEDSNSSQSPTMVETASPLLKSRAISSPTPRLSPHSQNFLASKMLLTPQNLSYFEQKFQQRNCANNFIKSDQKNGENICGKNPSSSSTSLFTIDSILSKQSRFVERSPSTSPISDNLFNKRDSMSPRLPPSALFQHHPAAAAAGLHITHLASNFGSPDFLGTF